MKKEKKNLFLKKFTSQTLAGQSVNNYGPESEATHRIHVSKNWQQPKNISDIILIERWNWQEEWGQTQNPRAKNWQQLENSSEIVRTMALLRKVIIYSETKLEGGSICK